LEGGIVLGTLCQIRILAKKKERERFWEEEQKE